MVNTLIKKQNQTLYKFLKNLVISQTLLIFSELEASFT